MPSVTFSISNPSNTLILMQTDPVKQLCHMMLKVFQIDHLMLHLIHLIPIKTTIFSQKI